MSVLGYEFDFDPSPNVVIHTVRIFIFIFTRIYPPPQITYYQLNTQWLLV